MQPKDEPCRKKQHLKETSQAPLGPECEEDAQQVRGHDAAQCPLSSLVCPSAHAHTQRFTRYNIEPTEHMFSIDSISQLVNTKFNRWISTSNSSSSSPLLSLTHIHFELGIHVLLTRTSASSSPPLTRRPATSAFKKRADYADYTYIDLQSSE